MSPTTTTLLQCEIPGGPQSVVVRHYSLAAVAEMEVDFRAVLPLEGPYAVGVSVELAPVRLCVIQTLSLALRDHVFCLSLQQPPSPVHGRVLQKLFSNILYLAGFELSYTIVLLAHTLGSDVSGYDLSSLTISAKPRDLTTPGEFLNRMNPSVTARFVNERWDGGIRTRDPDCHGTPDPNYALRAWFTAIAANMALPELRIGQLLSTKFVDKPMLGCFVDLATGAIRTDMLKPRIMENDFDQVQRTPDGSLTVENARFKTRIRASHQTRLEVHLANGDIVGARVRGANGRHSSAVAERAFREGISRIRVIGREERTNAQQAQYRFLVFSLTAARDVPLFVNVVWFPENTQAAECDEEIDLSCDHASRILVKLNHPQSKVVTAMVSTAPCDSLVIAHGPPGTGKTTTIAAASSIWVNRRLPCWIIAQSNVGVKNIAEKLFKEKVTFKLIVSKDFLFEWHEELYAGIEDVLIRSDELPNTLREISTTFQSTTLVLSTLTMLSNPKLEECGLLRLIPVRTLVIDEASQIDIFEFMHLFYKFSKVLTKVCFFGDPKQLPPYGAEAADLQTIFDVKHLKKQAYFLDTQYRLPIPLGEFISEKVYNGKLRSCHEIVDYSCIAFVDVWKGEERKRGSSYENVEEVHMVVRIAQRYHQRKLDFCIITFYDPQRAAITGALKAEDLPSERVYNVDSFQGNEADYVILSSVRTQQAGFLNSEPRMNVALTRCRKGMVVVTDKRFLQGAGRCTLLGQLCHAWSQHRDAWIDWKVVLSGSVELPGLPRPPPPSLPSRPLRIGLPVDIRTSASTPQPQSPPQSPTPPPPPSDEQTRPHSTPPPTIPRCDSETEFPSLRPSAASARPHGAGIEVRKTLRYNLIARRGSLAEVAAPRRDRDDRPQRPASTGTTTQQSSDSWRGLARPAPALPMPAAGRRQGPDTANAEFPPLVSSPATASATTATTNRSRGASWSTSAEHSPSRVFRREVEEISFGELSLSPSPSRASNSFHRRFQSST